MTANASVRPPRAKHGASLDSIVQNYGDLLFDLCESVLWSPANAQFAFRKILKQVRKQIRGHPFERHERAWILRIAHQVLGPFAERYGRRLSPAEQLMLDGMVQAEQRLGQIDSYFHRLPLSDQLLLLLWDKHKIPAPEISVAFGVPEDTLKLRRRQALRVIEEWIWEET